MSRCVWTLSGSLFGVSTVDIVATATAEATAANAETCIKPWAIPDKWTEKQTPPWDSTDTFDIEGRDVPIADPASKMIRPILS